MIRIPITKLGIDISLISPAAIRVATQLKDNGFEAYLVGGAVRDLLIGHAPKDFDVATDAHPEQIKRLFKRAWIIGKRFRLVHVRMRNQLIEVSTFRKAAKNVMRKANGMVIDDNTFGNKEEDAYRRDFTMNALMLDPLSGYVDDFTGGLADIRAKQMRIIGDATKRYQEDPVRILRALRLASKLDCTIEKKTLRAIKKQAHLLANINSSRLFEEVIKVIFSNASSVCFELFRTYGVQEILFPHMTDFSKNQLDFCATALNNVDRMQRLNLRISLTYAISALFWPVISARFSEAASAGDLNKEFMHTLFLSSGILDNPIMSRVVRGKVAAIWDYQASFHRKIKTREALGLQKNYSVAKALTFLRLRNETGELDETLPNWWEEFMTADKQERQAMVPARPKQQRKRKSTQDGSTESKT